MAELRAWMLAQLLWDPARDERKLMEEFCAGYYGPAGPHVLAYLDGIHDAVAAAGDKLGCYSPPTAKFLSFETLRAGWGHLEAAEAAVADDPDRLQRVRVAQLPVMYVFLLRWDELRARAAAGGADWPMDDAVRAVRDRFVAVAERARITRLNEWAAGFGPVEKAVARTKRR